MIGASVLFRNHASEAMRRRRIAPIELLNALGTQLVADGELQAPRATTADIAGPGRPIVLGWQPPGATHRDRRWVLLAKTPRGRHLVVVLAAGQVGVTIITVWDQDGEGHLWQSSRLTPTEYGRRVLPPTYWCADGQWDATGHRR